MKMNLDLFLSKLKNNLRTYMESEKIMYYPIETELGVITGRDAIYLDKINHDYTNRKLQFIGEINGALCSEINDDVFEKVCEKFVLKIEK